MFESDKKNPPISNPSAFTGPKTNQFFTPGVLQLQPVTPQQQKPALPTFTADSFVSGNFPNFDVQYIVNGPKPKTGTLFKWTCSPD